MATTFNKNYTELANVNSGNQLQNGDNILGDHVNVALQNTAHFKELTNNTVIRSASLSSNTIHLVLASKTNTGNVETSNLDIDISSLDGVKKNVTSGGYTSTIYNGGRRVSLSLTNTTDTYTLGFDSNGDLKFEYENYDEESGTSTTTITSLLKYPCFIEIEIPNSAKIYISSMSKEYFYTYSSLLNRVPTGYMIQASGYQYANEYCPIYAVELTSSWIKVYYIYNGQLDSTMHYSNNVTVRTQLKIF